MVKNEVLEKPGSGFCVVKLMGDGPHGNEYVIDTVYFDERLKRSFGSRKESDGNDDYESALRAFRRTVSLKKKRKGYKKAKNLMNLPGEVSRELTVASEWVGNEEMLKAIDEAKKERYVIFQDNMLVDGFDSGVEYFAILEDEYTLIVYDNYGQPRGLNTSRFASVEPTENVVELP